MTKDTPAAHRLGEAWFAWTSTRAEWHGKSLSASTKNLLNVECPRLELKILEVRRLQPVAWSLSPEHAIGRFGRFMLKRDRSFGRIRCRCMAQRHRLLTRSMDGSLWCCLRR